MTGEVGRAAMESVAGITAFLLKSLSNKSSPTNIYPENVLQRTARAGVGRAAAPPYADSMMKQPRAIPIVVCIRQTTHLCHPIFAGTAIGLIPHWVEDHEKQHKPIVGDQLVP